MKLVFSVSVFAVLFIGNLAAEWSYLELDEWPDTCKTGKRQSPIKLRRLLSRKTPIPALEFNDYETAYRSSLENIGHTVEAHILDNDTIPTLSGGNLEGEYTLDNVHFHWDSEHTINDKRFAVEAHLVHYKTEYGNVTIASNYTDGIVVLGVMFEEVLFNNKRLDKIIAATKIVAPQVDLVTQIKSLVIADFLPKDRTSFYKYEGSLTTPECNEVVTWIVFDRPLTIGRTQLKEFPKVVTSTGEKLTKNYRPLQKLNGRVVLHT